MCKICGDDRCIWKYLLHPKEVKLFVPRIEEAELKACGERTFKLVTSPSSGEIFTRFKELHVIAAPDENVEDIDNLPKAEVYVGDLKELVMQQPDIPPTKEEILAAIAELRGAGDDRNI